MQESGGYHGIGNTNERCVRHAEGRRLADGECFQSVLRCVDLFGDMYTDMETGPSGKRFQ